MDIHTLLDRLAAAKIPYETVQDTLDFSDALAHDWPVWISDKEQTRYYSFDRMPQEAFTDIMLEEIADSLRKSTKATGITLFHGDVTDKGMTLFLNALKETKAPISELKLDDLRGVTDASLKALPDIIKLKNITKCDVSGILRISDDLRKEIDKAVKAVHKTVFNETGKRLKTESTKHVQNVDLGKESR